MAAPLCWVVWSRAKSPRGEMSLFHSPLLLCRSRAHLSRARQIRRPIAATRQRDAAHEPASGRRERAPTTLVDSRAAQLSSAVAQLRDPTGASALADCHCARAASRAEAAPPNALRLRSASANCIRVHVRSRAHKSRGRGRGENTKSNADNRRDSYLDATKALLHSIASPRMRCGRANTTKASGQVDAKRLVARPRRLDSSPVRAPSSHTTTRPLCGEIEIWLSLSLGIIMRRSFGSPA